MDELKKTAIGLIKKWLKADLESQYDSIELALAALGVGPQAWRDSVIAAAETAYTSFSSARAAINGAADIPALREVWRTILQGRPDGAQYVGALGRGNKVVLD